MSSSEEEQKDEPACVREVAEKAGFTSCTSATSSSLVLITRSYPAGRRHTTRDACARPPTPLLRRVLQPLRVEMATQQQSLQASGSPSVVALLLAITPIYLFSVQARCKSPGATFGDEAEADISRCSARLGLDNLHLGLLQVVLLLVMGHLSSFIPAGLLQRRQKRQGGTTAAPALRVAEATPPPAPTAPTSVKRRHPPRPSPSKPASRKTNDRYPIPLLDGIVARFLACTSPEHLSLLPSPPTTPSEHITLSSWKVLHEAAGLRVLQHPSTPSLYGICAEFPEVPLRNLFEVLTNVESRTKWDGMCAEAREVEEVEVDVPLDGEGQPGKVKEVRGNVVWIGMKGMALIKPKVSLPRF